MLKSLGVNETRAKKGRKNENRNYKKTTLRLNFKTASGTRSTIKKNRKRLLSYTIINEFSYHRYRPRSCPRLTSTFTFDLPIPPMTDLSLLARARKARFDDLASFSGQPSEDVERFLKSIKNITKATNESNNHELLEIVRGKLTQSAGIWFDNNEAKFGTWSDFEMAFRNRYLSTTTTSKKFEQLKQRRQKPDELIINYCDEIINLCREVDPKMSDLTIIQYLLSGLDTNVRKELSRRESAMHSLDEFLKYAKIEQDLNDTFDKLGEISIDQQPQFDFSRPIHTTTATINARQYDFRNDERNYQAKQQVNKQSSDLERNLNTRRVGRTQIPSNSTRRTFPTRNWQTTKTPISQANTSKQNLHCMICDRKNHRTIDCFYKKKSGCFKCGEDHMIRDCEMLTNFQ